MTFYHGSSVGGLTKLQPFVKPWSNLKQPLVYMTSSKQLAAYYIRPTEKYEIKSPLANSFLGAKFLSLHILTRFQERTGAYYGSDSKCH
jgi:hypothetical protein